MTFLLQVVMAAAVASDSSQRWPLWESYAARFIDDQGRVIDRDGQDRTTSEAQAYAMFFALVANDLKRFQALLRWTEENLAYGSLRSHLPAWHWGKSESGDWGIRDQNSASDADLWMAYTLVEAGTNWQRPDFLECGLQLTRQIASREVLHVPHLGPVLLPGAHGFRGAGGKVTLNASYLPLQVILRLAAFDRRGPWREMATRLPALLTQLSPNGLSLDWTTYRAGTGFAPEDANGRLSVSGYDAIRVYLWAGMLDKATPGRAQMLVAMNGMAEQIRKNPSPPAEVSHTGVVKTPNAGVGFSASLTPYLFALGENSLASEQQRRVTSARDPETGLFGAKPSYYDQNLILFSSGWYEGRYGFGKDGTLKLLRRQK